MVSRNNKRSKSISERLELLVSLLNASSEKLFAQELRDSEWENLGTDWAIRAWQTQQEIVADLKPLVEPATTTMATEGLKGLIRKINSLQLRPVWDAWPARPVLWTVRSRGKKVRVPNPAWSKLGTGQGTLKVGKISYIVSMVFGDEKDARKFLYGVIVAALQSGALEQLRRCQWEECRRFFIRDDLRRKAYCSKECATAYDRRDAADRVRKWRQT